MNNELAGKVILVTGGAMGIGEAVVRRAVAFGAQVAIVDFNMEAANKLASALPGCKAYSADVSNAGDMERVCAEIVKDFGQLNGAVNNAGTGGEFAPAGDCTQENWERTLGINLNGVFYSVKAELPYLLKAGGGPIVNMASMAGVGAEENLVAYIASKHGVVGLTKSVALDYGKHNIRCNAVCPSFVKTPMTQAGMPEEVFEQIAGAHPLRRLVTADEVAATTVFLLTDGAAGMTGSVHLVDGGIGAR